MRYNEALELAEKYDATLRAVDLRFQRSVKVIHEDESNFHYSNAFLMQKDRFVFLFAEHYPAMVFDKDDLVEYTQFETIHTQLEEL